MENGSSIRDFSVAMSLYQRVRTSGLFWSPNKLKTGIGLSWIDYQETLENKPNQARFKKVYNFFVVPSGKRLNNDGQSPCLMGKLTISMA